MEFGAAFSDAFHAEIINLCDEHITHCYLHFSNKYQKGKESGNYYTPNQLNSFGRGTPEEQNPFAREIFSTFFLFALAKG